MKNMRMRSGRTGFTIIELLVVVSIIALLIGILLPAVGKARDQARLVGSEANMRNLAVAHQSYAAEFADRQLTLVNDQITSYGGSMQAFNQYYISNGGTEEGHGHPGPILGWGYINHDGPYRLFIYRTHEANDDERWDGSFNQANASLNIPINFTSGVRYFGSFRLINVQQFHQYVGGKFYDPTFYSPKDVNVQRAVDGGGWGGVDCFEDPGQYCDRPDVAGQGEIPAWSSYVTSPAAMFAPAVMSHDDPDDLSANGWVDPWSLGAGFRSPGFSQALYPSLKTHMLEHHWLQGLNTDQCNPGFSAGPYPCEPYYFNHSWESSPVTLFYDGHIETLGVRETMRADGRMRTQTGNDDWGLWSRDTPYGENGYYIDAGYDQADTSFHILTTDGIRGRDITG